MKYCKKPVVIEAMQHKGSEDSAVTIASWSKGAVKYGYDHNLPEGQFMLYVDTLEGSMAGAPGDWIIQGVQGEFYPCKPDIFEATYEVVS